MKKKTRSLDALYASIRRGCAASFPDSVPVLGEGPPNARLMVIGEAPGRDETRLERPFVGKAGSFFVNIMEETLKVSREEVYITNVLKVWPTVKTKRLKTRKPLQREEDFFIPFLKEEIGIIGPLVILAVGKTAFRALLPLERFSPGKLYRYGKAEVVALYHPSYILRRQKSLEESVGELKNALRKARKRLQ